MQVIFYERYFAVFNRTASKEIKLPFCGKQLKMLGKSKPVENAISILLSHTIFFSNLLFGPGTKK